MNRFRIAGALALAALLAQGQVVSFKDAAKIKSWEAWDDHKGPQVKKEKRCVT